MYETWARKIKANHILATRENVKFHRVIWGKVVGSVALSSAPGWLSGSHMRAHIWRAVVYSSGGSGSHRNLFEQSGVDHPPPSLLGGSTAERIPGQPPRCVAHQQPHHRQAQDPLRCMGSTWTRGGSVTIKDYVLLTQSTILALKRYPCRAT